MGVGATLTKAQIDDVAAHQTRSLNILLDQVGEMKEWLDGKPDSDLGTGGLGYTAAEIADLRSAYADLDELRRIYEGGVALLVVKDFRTFPRRMWGLGF